MFFLIILEIHDRGGEIVEDVLTSGLSAKLMCYLRLRVLADPNNGNQKDPCVSSESKYVSGTSACRGRKDNAGKLSNVFEGSRFDAPRMAHEDSLVDVSLDREQSIIGTHPSLFNKFTYSLDP